MTALLRLPPAAVAGVVFAASAVAAVIAYPPAVAPDPAGCDAAVPTSCAADPAVRAAELRALYRAYGRELLAMQRAECGPGEPDEPRTRQAMMRLTDDPVYCSLLRRRVAALQEYEALANAHRDLPPPAPLTSEDCAVFLDFDGTLVEIAERPDAV